MVTAQASKAERLRAAVAAHAAAHATQGLAAVGPVRSQPRGDPPPIREILRGEWHDTRFGQAFVRDEWYPLEHHHGKLPLGATLAASAESLRALARSDVPDPAALGFFDIETTGLGGGTGTYVILAGLGWFGDGGFRLRQYFLADVGAERAMLVLLAEDLGRLGGIVTYNGKAFDLPILGGRFALARMAQPLVGAPHLDLLHAVRRLYKHRMPGCTLADAERRILRLHRHDDVAGALIPSLYFDYVRAGRAGPLRAVFAHNADDVLSMAGILSRVASLLDGAAPLDAEDAAAVARWWEREGDEARAAGHYRAALPWLEGGDDWAWAAVRHARLCRRAGRFEEARELWRRLWEARDRQAGLALAKHLEHRERDFEGAARVTEELLADGDADDESLNRRLARIQVKWRRAVG